MSGFTDAIVGGASNLIRKAIRSPNFVAGLSGWSINKDGSAEFDNLIVRGTFDGTNFELNSRNIYVLSEYWTR